MARPSKRDQIIDAALDQFHARGFNGTGVKDITDAAGAPKGSFYNHFESKEALAALVLERYGESRRLAELAEGPGDPLGRLRAHFEFQRGETQRHGFTRGCLFGNFGTEIADGNEAIRHTVRTGLDHWEAALAAALAQARAAGSVRADLDPHRTARYLIGAWEGALISARAQRDGAAFDIFFELTFGTLLAPPSAP